MSAARALDDLLSSADREPPCGCTTTWYDRTALLRPL